MITLKRIEELVAEKGITEKQFLIDVGLNKSAMSDWRKGTTKSYEKHIAKIAEYFNVSTDYLLGRTDKKNETPKGDILDDFLMASFGDPRDYTEEELEEIRTFARFVKSKREDKK